MADQINKQLRDLSFLRGLLPSDFLWGDCLQVFILSEILDRYDAARNAATPAAPATTIEGLTRWDFRDIDGDYQNFVEVINGEFVKFSDVQALLAAPADPEQAKLDSLAQAGLAAALENHAKGCAGAVAVEQAIPEDLINVVGMAVNSVLFSEAQVYGVLGKAEVERLADAIRNEFAEIGKAFLPPLASQPQAAPDVIALLLDVVRAAWHAMDNTEQNEHGHVWNAGDFHALSAAMDKIEALPDDRPGYVMGPAAKAEWALRAAIQAAPEATSEHPALSPEDIDHLIEYTADVNGFDTTTPGGVDALIHAVVDAVVIRLSPGIPEGDRKAIEEFRGTLAKSRAPEATSEQTELNEFEELLGQYWELAYNEGNGGNHDGNKANTVLTALRAAWNRRATIQPTADSEHDFDADGVCRQCCAYSSKAHLPCVAPVAPTDAVRDARNEVEAALELAAQTVELFDDATMQADYMLDSADCANIIRALKPSAIDALKTDTKEPVK